MGRMRATVGSGRDRTSGRKFSSAQFAAVKRHVATISALVEMNWCDASRNIVSAGVSPAARLRSELERTRKIRLSLRQAEVALLVLQGHSSRSIASNLGVSPNTVNVFRRQLYTKCNLSSQAELFASLLPLVPEHASGS